MIDKIKIQKLIAPHLLSQTNSYPLVFVDGVFIADLIPEKTLPVALAKIEYEAKQFRLTIAPNVILPAPIHMLFVTTGEENNEVKKEQESKILLSNESNASFIEEHIAPDNAKIIYNSNTVLHAEDAAQIFYYKIFNAPLAQHESILQLEFGEESAINTYHLILAAAELKEKIVGKLTKVHAVCDNRGLYMLKGQQKINLDILLEHVATDCKSKVLFKGLAADEAQGHFFGKIMVREGAGRSTARLDNKNLLLHNTAKITSSPALEIYADDVQCSHGATVGQLDAQALWYLQSRGINPEQAKQILIQAFLQEIVHMLPKFLQEKMYL